MQQIKITANSAVYSCERVVNQSAAEKELTFIRNTFVKLNNKLMKGKDSLVVKTEKV